MKENPMQQMTSGQLKDFLGEVVTFLQALDKLIPSKLDADLIAWLQEIEQQDLTLELIVKALPLAQAKR